MSSLICLSSAPNLRCESLSRIQHVTLIIPPVIEVIFCASLILGKRGSSSKRHLLLVAEGWGYFSLALFDMLLHITPAARNSLDSFNILDIFIASTSLLPLLLYTLFLYLFVSDELLSILSRRFQSITRCTLLILVPFIPTLNTIASFVGVSRRAIPGSTPILGFNSKHDQAVWTFFSSLTLALLTFQQAITFLLTFYQIIRIFIDRRRIQMTKSDEAHLFNGVGWIATGIKLGTVETVIGFASMGFTGVLARRILRLLGRSCLIIGIMKGMDKVEDFRNLHNELRSRHSNRAAYSKSRLKPLISNPRNSTFRRLSPSEVAFHSTPRGPFLPPDPFEKSPSVITFGAQSPLASPKYRFSSTSARRNQTYSFVQSAAYQSSGLATPVQTATLRTERVTIHYEQGHAPTLEMRFSTLDLPCAVVLAEDTKSRPQSEWRTSGTPPSARMLSITEYPNEPSSFSRDFPIASPKPVAMPRLSTSTNANTTDTSAPPHHMRDNSYVGHARIMSAASIASDSFDVIRDLASRFPGLPPRVTGKSTDTLPMDYYSEDEFPVIGVSRQSSVKTFKSGDALASTINTISRSNSLAKRKPVPPVPPIRKDAASMHGSAQHEVSDNLKDGDMPLPNTYTQASYPPSDHVSKRASSPDMEENPFMNNDNDMYSMGDLGSSENGGGSIESVPPAKWLRTPSRSQSTKSVDIEAYRKGIGRASKAVSTAPSEATEQGDINRRVHSTASLEPAWPEDITADAAFEAEKEMWSCKDLTRIKSVGKAPKKMTPTPTHADFLRESVTLERLGISLDAPTKTMNDEIVTQDSDTH